jgi:hypothetical protein
MFTDNDAGRFLFHYTSGDVFLTHILPTMRMRMSSFSRLNDPRESKNWVCNLVNPDGLQQEWDLAAVSEEFTARIKGSAKVLCLVQDDPYLNPGRTEYLYGRGYAHPSMWDRYANHHSGVCLAFDREQLGQDLSAAVSSRGDLMSGAVSYQSMSANDVEAFELDAGDLESKGIEQALRDHQRLHATALFFCKSRDWESEFEFRWVLLGDSEAGEPYIDVSRSLKGVLFGDAFLPHAIPMVASVVEGREIVLARIVYRNGDPIVLPA